MMQNTTAREAYVNPLCPVCEHKAHEWFKKGVDRPGRRQPPWLAGTVTRA
jgi:hypothetical protein